MSVWPILHLHLVDLALVEDILHIPDLLLFTSRIFIPEPNHIVQSHTMSVICLVSQDSLVWDLITLIVNHEVSISELRLWLFARVNQQIVHCEDLESVFKHSHRQLVLI